MKKTEKEKEYTFQKLRFAKLMILLIAAILVYMSANQSYITNFVDSFK